MNAGRTLKGYTKMKRFLKASKKMGLCALFFGLHVPNTWAVDSPSIGQLHPPVIASLGKQKVSVFFLKNNLKDKVSNVHVADAEIFYTPINFGGPELSYIWKVEGEEIASVFFFEKKSADVAGKSMYLLTRSHVENKGFRGLTYSVMEMPIIKEGDKISIKYFPGDPLDSVLQNCNEGQDLVTGKAVICDYKDAAAIKKYLASQDR